MEAVRRNLALKLLVAPKGNHKTLLEMAKTTAFHNTLNSFPDWNTIMEGWEFISQIRRDNPYPDECEEGEIIIDQMEMGGKGAIIKAFQMKDGKWVNIEDHDNHWFGITWVAYNVFASGCPEASNSNSFKEAVWKTVTDFAMFWCQTHVEDYKNELETT